MERLTAQRAANRRQASTGVAKRHARRGASNQASTAVSQSLKQLRCQAIIQLNSDGSSLGEPRTTAVFNGQKWAVLGGVLGSDGDRLGNCRAAMRGLSRSG